MRTTFDFDKPIFRKLKQLKKKESKFMGRLVSDLLVQVMRDDVEPAAGRPPAWISRPMYARVVISAKEALYPVLAG